MTYEKLISIPETTMKKWMLLVERGDKIRIARNHNLLASDVTVAFKHRRASTTTIAKIDKYFEICKHPVTV